MKKQFAIKSVQTLKAVSKISCQIGIDQCIKISRRWSMLQRMGLDTY